MNADPCESGSETLFRGQHSLNAMRIRMRTPIRKNVRTDPNPALLIFSQKIHLFKRRAFLKYVFHFLLLVSFTCN
jgi:hypothetical protein